MSRSRLNGSPRQTSRNPNPPTDANVQPRNHLAKDGQRPGKEEHAATGKTPDTRPGGNGQRPPEPAHEPHFVQTRHVKRQVPDHLHREPIDEETFITVARKIFDEKVADGEDPIELEPWEIRLATRYAIEYNVNADESLRFVLSNREDLHYIADELGFDIKKERNSA